MTQKHVKINDKVTFGNDLPFVLIAGPCAIENRDHAMKMAEEMIKLTDKLGIPYVYKSSFDKANRTSIHSQRGVGLEEGAKILKEIKDTFGCAVTTDIHEVSQADYIKDCVDIIQIPAFLARQTDLLVAAAKTGKVVNIKKGQFMAPWDMKNSYQKVVESQNDRVMLIERGNSFGYNTLIVDLRSFPEMKKATGNAPVIMDATHSVQIPGGLGCSTGGQREYIPLMAKSALTAKISGLFMEVHNNPPEAPCDSTNMFYLNKMEELLLQLKDLDNMIKSQEDIDIS